MNWAVPVLIGAGAFALWVVYFLLAGAARRRAAKRAIKITTPNGVQETLFVPLGGVEQCISIRGEDCTNPVLLILHGGMAMSYMPLSPLLRAWEKDFTLVQWDRRGVAATFQRSGRKGMGEMSLQRIIADGIELAEYLHARLPGRRLVLLGHSMGSMIGASMAAARPDLFAAYVGSEQIVSMVRNEAVSYEMVRARLAADGKTRALAKLDRLGPPPYRALRKWGVKQGLVETADEVYGAVFTEKLRPALGAYFDLRGLTSFIGGNIFCGGKLYDQWMAFDAAALGPRFGLPMIVIQGEDDVMTPTRLAEEWLASLVAPRKELATIAGVGHLAMFVRPAVFLQVLLEKTQSAISPAPTRAA